MLNLIVKVVEVTNRQQETQFSRSKMWSVAPSSGQITQLHNK